jgi:hypothetical protein
MSVIKGTFGKEEVEKPTAQDCLEQFLEQITKPAMEEGHESVDAVVLQLDDYGVSVGSNYEDPAHIIMLLELAKLSMLEKFLGAEFATGGTDGTVH